jgi:hypothetical protein
MKKGITSKEYFKRTKKEKEELAKQGIIDFQEKRVKRIFVEEKPYGIKDEEQK